MEYQACQEYNAVYADRDTKMYCWLIFFPINYLVQISPLP